MLNAGIDIQDNNPTGPEHNEGGDSAAQAPALHTKPPMTTKNTTAMDGCWLLVRASSCAWRGDAEKEEVT